MSSRSCCSVQFCGICLVVDDSELLDWNTKSSGCWPACTNPVRRTPVVNKERNIFRNQRLEGKLEVLGKAFR